VLGTFHLTVVGRFEPPANFRPTFATTNELAQLSRLFDRVEATDPRTAVTRSYTMSRENLPPYNRVDPSRYRGFLGDRGYAFVDRIPPGGDRPLSGRMLGNHLVKMAIQSESTNRWVLRRGATLGNLAPVNTGQGSIELILPADADQEFYRIDPLP